MFVAVTSHRVRFYHYIHTYTKGIRETSPLNPMV